MITAKKLIEIFNKEEGFLYGCSVDDITIVINENKVSVALTWNHTHYILSKRFGFHVNVSNFYAAICKYFMVHKRVADVAYCDDEDNKGFHLLLDEPISRYFPNTMDLEMVLESRSVWDLEYAFSDRLEDELTSIEEIADDYICGKPDEKSKEDTSQTAKADAGKPQLSLVPIDELWKAIARVREYGNKKYGDPENWRQVDISRYKDAFLRHVSTWTVDPNGVDEESGLPHLWHAACNLAFIFELSKDERSGGE